MCIRLAARPSSATASTAPGRCKARTSLTSCAPASATARITSGWLVSTDIGTSVAAATALTVGIRRRSSSSSGTGVAPGRVDSPPISISAAPSATICSACATALPGSVKSPPSENESGVTLRIPITRGRSKSIRQRGMMSWGFEMVTATPPVAALEPDRTPVSGISVVRPGHQCRCRVILMCSNRTHRPERRLGPECHGRSSSQAGAVDYRP